MSRMQENAPEWHCWVVHTCPSTDKLQHQRVNWLSGIQTIVCPFMQEIPPEWHCWVVHTCPSTDELRHQYCQLVVWYSDGSFPVCRRLPWNGTVGLCRLVPTQMSFSINCLSGIQIVYFLDAGDCAGVALLGCAHLSKHRQTPAPVLSVGCLVFRQCISFMQEIAPEWHCARGSTSTLAKLLDWHFKGVWQQVCPTLPCPVLPRPAPPCLPCPALPRPALPCPALPCPALPCPALPCPAQPRPAQPRPALPCPALPCPALPRPAPPCPALPCPALPCPALPRLSASQASVSVLSLLLCLLLRACVWLFSICPTHLPAPSAHLFKLFMNSWRQTPMDRLLSMRNQSSHLQSP